MNTYPAASCVAIPELPSGWFAQHHAILNDSSLAIVGANFDVECTFRRAREEASVVGSREIIPQTTTKIWIFTGNDLLEGPEFPLLAAFPMAARFKDGRWLVASCRSRGESNARVLSSEGKEHHRFALGDGIQHLGIDDAGQIWVGYFDEGVFGNDGWTAPGLDYPPSAFGIAVFDEVGNFLKHVEQRHEIADVYAMNVANSDVWACTYTEWSILKLNRDSEKSWQADLPGTSALAVEFPYVVAAGGYAEDRGKLELLLLDDARATSVAKWRLPYSEGKDSRIDLLKGKGDELHLVHAGHWYRWRVRDFVKSATD